MNTILSVNFLVVWSLFEHQRLKRERQTDSRGETKRDRHREKERVRKKWSRQKEVCQRKRRKKIRKNKKREKDSVKKT